jgi:hypothetical protein
MKATMEEFKRLCDETIILLNNAGKKEKDLVEKYGFKWIEDNREWGKTQNLIKQDFMEEVGKLNPDWCIALDMDEVFEPKFTRKELERITNDGWAFHFFVVNLWNDGHKPQWNFWNVRMWKWTGNTEFENRPLHPGLAPKWAYQINQYAPYILRHYGLKRESDRKRKIKRYEKYDPNARYRSRAYYNALKTNDCSPYDEEKLHNEVEAYVTKYKPLIKKKPMTQIKKDFSVIRRTNIRTGEDFSFDVPTADIPRYLSQSNQFLRFELIGKVENMIDDMDELFNEPAKEPEFEPKTENSAFKRFTPKRVKKTK